MRALVIADATPQLGMPIPDFVRAHRVDVVITAGDLNRYKLTGIGQARVPTMCVRKSMPSRLFGRTRNAEPAPDRGHHRRCVLHWT